MIDSFWGNIFRQQEKEEENIRKTLKRIPIFEGLSRKELRAIERILHRRQYATGEVIFHQGEPSAGMYIIVEGKVRIFLEPTQQVVAELHDGDFFGELALLNESPRSATPSPEWIARCWDFLSRICWTSSSLTRNWGLKL